MMNEPTLDKLRQLKLLAMANAWVAQRGDTSLHDLDFDSRLALLVDAEALARDNKRMQKLLYDAKLRIPGACIEDLDHGAKRELDRALVRQLATGRWIAEKQNVIATGMTGVGKTYFACALGSTPAVLAFVSSIDACRASSRNSRWRTLTAPTRACWRASPKQTCSSSMTGVELRSAS